MRNKVGNFFRDLRFRLELFNKYKESFNRYLSNDFSFFDYISTDENRLSDIIADLLNPKGKHGQKEVFLSEFLKLIEKSEKFDSGKGNIIREKTTDYLVNSQRRIDITIDFGESGIGIENKPWAVEQKDQMKEYNEYLNKKYNGNYLLIFLSGSAIEPQSLSESERELLKAKEKLVTIYYPIEFRTWLESCYKQCDSEKLRFFLKDLIEFVETNFKIESAEY